MSNFSEAWAITKLLEGGYQNYSEDTGNYLDGVLIGTKYGITPRFYYSHTGIKLTAEQMKNLSDSEAAALVKRVIWDKYQLKEIPCQSLANQIFDLLFHFSYYRASELIQSAIVQIGGDKYLPVYGQDNKFGPETLNALITLCKEGKDSDLINTIVALQKNYYAYKVETDPETKVFEKGWFARAETFAVTTMVTGWLIGGLLVAGYYMLNK